MDIFNSLAVHFDRKGNRESEANSTDRFTDLPDDVIRHALSFLPADSAVQTRLISKRWRFLWSKNRNPPFHVSSSSSNHSFESWIDAVFARNVRNLIISPPDDHQLPTLPRRLFTCETLVDLCVVDIHVDCTVRFPALKKLRLVNVGFDSSESLPRLLSGCLLLEELSIIDWKLCRCEWYVSSHNLTRLVLDLDDVTLKLDTPALTYLGLRLRNYSWFVPDGLLELDSLVEADIDLNQDKVDMFESRCFNYNDLAKFLAKSCNAKRLTLSTRRMELYTCDSDGWSLFSNAKFHHLTQLDLCADWLFISSFLENANNLRVLTIRRMIDHNAQCWTEPKGVPECLSCNLETVNVVDFGFVKEHEFEMFRYILKNAKVLRRLDMVCTRRYQLYWDKKLEVLDRIASFETLSACLRLRLRRVSDMSTWIPTF